MREQGKRLQGQSIDFSKNNYFMFSMNEYITIVDKFQFSTSCLSFDLFRFLRVFMREQLKLSLTIIILVLSQKNGKLLTCLNGCTTTFVALLTLKSHTHTHINMPKEKKKCCIPPNTSFVQEVL